MAMKPHRTERVVVGLGEVEVENLVAPFETVTPCLRRGGGRHSQSSRSPTLPACVAAPSFSRVVPRPNGNPSPAQAMSPRRLNMYYRSRHAERFGRHCFSGSRR